MTSQPAMIAALILATAAAVTDLKTRTIPNAMVMIGTGMGLILNIWMSGAAGLKQSALGAVAGFCVFLPFFLLRGMGAGDVKLMGALGSCLGPLAILQTALAASFAGAAFAVAAAVRHGALRSTFLNTGRLLRSWLTRGPRPSKELSLDNPRALKIPYALPIAAGSFFIVLSGS